jgi:F0F1-type ATP synthase epsilon subunit
MSVSLTLTVRTPQEVVLQQDVSSIRVPTETGQVGIRPRAEPLVVAVEPGVVLVRLEDEYQFVGTAGGLLRWDGGSANLLTPLAVTGREEDVVIRAVEQLLAQPSAELEARTTLERMQTSILRELQASRTKERLDYIEGT